MKRGRRDWLELSFDSKSEYLASPAEGDGGVKGFMDICESLLGTSVEHGSV